MRRKIEERYYGAADQPVSLQPAGQHVTSFRYDEFGNIVELRYGDAAGRPTLGYAREFGLSQRCGGWQAIYNAQHELTGEGRCVPLKR
jgi:YD repeat-containing protein